MLVTVNFAASHLLLKAKALVTANSIFTAWNLKNAIKLHPESGTNGNLSLLLEEKVATKSTDEVSPLQ